MVGRLAWIAALALLAAAGTGSAQETHQFTLTPVYPPATAAARAAVHIAIDHGKPTARNGPGFQASISGWTPNGLIGIVLVGPHGESVEVLPLEHPMQTGADGLATVLVPYQMQGLTPGPWTLVIDGASGKHEVPVQIPAVLAADATHKDARLLFPPPAPDAASVKDDASSSKAAASQHR